ncbi:MAG: PASTA domain-containing protein, partial [Clostridiales bacterium]|nr:PASTA domain-containing protein [Clostridiales bacterium]
PMDPHKAAAIAKQVASALSMAHKHQLIHRDVKPHNIMLTYDGGIAKITDFGIAKAVNTETLVGEQKEAVMGSVHYFSPEQARGGYVDEKSDIYSLGIVLYEMLTGKVPFDGDTAVAVAVKHMNEEMVPPSQLQPDIPSDLENIVMKATNKLQTGRYRSADEMITALNFVKFSRSSGSKNASERNASGKSSRGGSQSSFFNRGRASQGNEPSTNSAQNGSMESENVDKLGFDGDMEPEEKKKAFNWAYIIVIILAIALAFPASGLIKKIISFKDSGVIKSAEEIRAPSVLNMSVEEANAQLKSLGLSVEIEFELQSPDYPKGIIMSQTPAEGATIKTGQTIRVSVSKGVVDGEVPSVVGKTLNNARITLETYKYVVNEVVEQIDEEVPKGSVISQNPVAGTRLAAGSFVNLVVSKGSEKDASRDSLDLTGMSLEAARQTLEELELVEGNIKYENSDTVPADCIISQDPPVGRSLEKGATVNMVVSNGPEIVIVDNPDGSIDTSAVTIWVEYAKAVNEEFKMTITVTDSVGSPRTPYSQVSRNKSMGGENVSIKGSGAEGKMLVFFDNALVHEFAIDFTTGAVLQIN